MAIIDLERSKNLYNARAYIDYTDNWEDDVSRHRAIAFLSALDQANLLDRIESILDVGCGAGGVLAELATDSRLAAVHLSGRDISSIAIEMAVALGEKKGVASRVKYDVGSVSHIDPNSKYSVISLIHVLEHCPDMLEMLSECEKVSKFIYINVPLEFNVFYAARSGVLLNQYKKYGHVHFFDESFFLEWLSSNNFELISKVYSRDYLVNKSGVFYNLFKFVRKSSERLFGARFTIRYLAGLSGGYLVRKKAT